MRNVLIVTAALGERDIARANDFDIFGLIPKPFDVETLLAAVKQCATTSDSSLGGTLFNGTMMLLLADLIQKRLM
jgi:DNA-binding NarL/FixJ family response regulator